MMFHWYAMGFPTHGTTRTHVIRVGTGFRGLGLVLRDADGTLQKEEGARASGGTAEPTV